jgi:F0F1-type ATP synthase assembly protein I
MAENPENSPGPIEDKDLKNKLAALDVALQNQQKEAAETKAQSGLMVGGAKLDAKALRASRIGTELMVAICAGLGLGWLLDEAASTRPLFMLVFAFLGFGAGILNVWRLMNGSYGKVGIGNEDKGNE